MSEVVPTSSAAVAIATPVHDESTQRVIDAVKATGKFVGANAFLVSAMNAATLEEATDLGEVISARDHLNERIRFVDVAFLESDPDLEGDVPIFAVMTVIREMGDGVTEKMSCGASHVLGVMIAAAVHDWFPFDAELVTQDLGKGRSAINVHLAPRKVESAKDF